MLEKTSISPLIAVAPGVIQPQARSLRTHSEKVLNTFKRS